LGVLGFPSCVLERALKPTKAGFCDPSIFLIEICLKNGTGIYDIFDFLWKLSTRAPPRTLTWEGNGSSIKRFVWSEEEHRNLERKPGAAAGAN